MFVHKRYLGYCLVLCSIINIFNNHTVPAISFDADVLFALENQTMLDVCATITDVPTSGIACNVTLTLTTTTEGKAGTTCILLRFISMCTLL